MMHPEPIVLTADEHRRHIESFWRQHDADLLLEDVLYDDQLRAVAHSMQEPPVMHMPRAEVWLVAAMLWVPLIVIAAEWFRP